MAFLWLFPHRICIVDDKTKCQICITFSPIPLCIQGLATETKKANEMSFSCTQDGIGINFAQCRKTHMVSTCSVNKECLVVLLLYLVHVQSITFLLMLQKSGCMHVFLTKITQLFTQFSFQLLLGVAHLRLFQLAACSSKPHKFNARSIVKSHRAHCLVIQLASQLDNVLFEFCDSTVCTMNTVSNSCYRRRATYSSVLQVLSRVLLSSKKQLGRSLV